MAGLSPAARPPRSPPGKPGSGGCCGPGPSTSPPSARRFSSSAGMRGPPARGAAVVTRFVLREPPSGAAPPGAGTAALLPSSVMTSPSGNGPRGWDRSPAPRRSGFLRTALLALVAVAVVAPLGAEDAVMPLAEVRAGQKGYGVSVFSGTTRERFDVEILGVVRNLEPNVSRVLARLSGRGLESTGVIAGMSGSPVYIDGKLMGAVAYAWPFAKEAIAQITPIESMRDLDAGGGAIPAVGASSTPLDLAALLPQKADREALAKALERLQPRGGGGASPVAWNVAGFAPRTQELFAIGLGAVSPSGEAVPGTLSADLQPGDAVAAVLIDGDLRLAATGTVTDRLGEDVLAFGHPFYGLGPVDIPMAPAEVVAVIANQYSSFKISNFGEPIGAFAQDRLAGIRGRIGEQAATLPVTVKVDSGRGADYRLRLARVPQLTPTLLAISLI